MTREEFVRAYAKRSGLSDKYAVIGMIELPGQSRLALPCACDSESCEGWAMVDIESLDHHLTFCTPEPMRTAYLNAPEPMRTAYLNAPEPMRTAYLNALRATEPAE